MKGTEVAFHVGQTVILAGETRRLVRRLNTLGDWYVSAPVNGRLCWNEESMRQFQTGTPVRNVRVQKVTTRVHKR